MPLKIQRKQYDRRGKSEKAIIQRYKYFFGRTDWDLSHVTAINPESKYIKVRELFRKAFIEGDPWDIKAIQKHTVFYAGGARVPLKGFHKFLEALALIKKKHPDVIVYVAGIMPNKRIPFLGAIGYGKYLNRIIKREGLSENIVFTGPLSSEKMLEKFQHSHCFVLGSSIENSSNTLVEAMLVGAPSVVACVGGVENFAVHEVTSYIYRFEEVEMLAHYIGKIFADNTNAQNLSVNARNRIRDVLEGNENDLMQAYERVIDDFKKGDKK